MFNIIIKFYNAFRYSWNGLTQAWKTQWAFRVEIILLAAATPLAFYFSTTPIELVLMITSVVLLPLLELLNSAIETTVNRIGLEYHELSGRAKDMASAAIFVAGLNVLITWGIILVSHFS
ncbi:Diacylglycerol kinase [Aquicella siphonis]|uniref:Diacylglycerol kinase n=1 Tax=Aquicella siphonis TaxID=254247 RepID=A0A5E4PDH0_9COXI|nr:diacylglycerol kinase [Aquicella siphonis]VVC74960.1 Diacylglycerol kinase [Aquicella siphonis]